jgi:hypothetical protein
MIFNKEVWLVGKGSSIHRYDWKQAGQRICINDSVFVVPDPDAAIAIDYPILDLYRKKLDPRIYVLRKQSHVNWEFPHMVLFNYNDHAPFDRTSTSVIALQVLWSLGVETFHMVGFDSFQGDLSYAEGVLPGKSENLFKINTAIINVLDKIKVRTVWEHTTL